MKTIKKIWFLLIIAITGIVFVGCNFTSNSEVLKTTDEVLGFQAMSSVTLLNNFSSTSTTLSSREGTPSFTLFRLAQKEVSQEQIDQINQYITIMDQLLAGGSPVQVAQEVSDNENYAFKLVVTTKDINLNEITYVMYYNEIASEVNEEQENDEQENEEQENEEQENEEQEILLEGIIYIGEKEFTVTGKKEIKENEVKVEFTSKLDSKNWVKVVQVTEENESKFRYTVVENGVMTSTDVKFEEEDNSVKMMLTTKNGSNITKYQFKQETEDGIKIIKINVKSEELNANIKVYVTTNVETGEVTYTYKFVETGKQTEGKGHHEFGKENKGKK